MPVIFTTIISVLIGGVVASVTVVSLVNTTTRTSPDPDSSVLCIDYGSNAEAAANNEVTGTDIPACS